MKPKTTKRKRTMTMEEFASAIQADLLALRHDMAEGFRAVRAETATKADLALLKDELLGRFATHAELISMKNELLDEIGKIRYAKEIDELRGRVRTIEKELGIAQ